MNGLPLLDIFSVYDGKRRTMVTVPGRPNTFRMPETGAYSGFRGETVEFKLDASGKYNRLMWSEGYELVRYQ